MADNPNVTPPLTPADCDLRGLEWMPLDVARVMDSDMFALSTGEEFKAAFALWCKSWAQVPAGSLPDDDRVLSRLSGAGSRWKKVRAMALRGWILCSDGRLYHRVVSEKAREAFDRRIRDRERKNKWRTEKVEQSAECDGDKTGTGRGRDADGTVLSPLNGTDRTGQELREEDQTTPSLVAEPIDDLGEWPAEDHDALRGFVRPPSDNRSRGQRSAGDVIANLLPSTGPPEKRLKRQDKADTEMANWLMTREGKMAEEAWRTVQAARDEDHPDQRDCARYLEKLSRKHKLGWFAEEMA